MRKVYIAYAFDEERALFFSRFKNALDKMNMDLLILTNRPSIVRKFSGSKIISKPVGKSYTWTDAEAVVKSSIEFNVGGCSVNSGLLLFESIVEALDELKQNLCVEGFFVWNGSKLADRAISCYAKSNNIPVLFFENSNIPGRMFVDPLGVNGESSLALDESVLARFSSPLSNEEFLCWKEKYVSACKGAHKVHQAANVKKINLRYVLDRVIQLFKGIPNVEQVMFYRKVIDKINAKFRNKNNTAYGCLPEKFVFFPFQVKTDSQLIFNSDVSNLDALREISSCVESGMKIVAKQHPAEGNMSIKKHYSKIMKESGIIESNINTFKLIEMAEEVYTINSTVGLQAMLFEKPVHFLGRTVFKNLSFSQLNDYIFGYLFPLEYFDDYDITDHQVKDLLNRMCIERV